MSNMGFTCMLPFISEYAVVVNLLEQHQRRSDSSLRRRQAGAEKFGAGGMEAGFIYERQKSGRGRNTPYYSSLPILCRRESFDVVGCMTLDHICNKGRVRT
jgi:hypothetical protein